MQHHNNIIVGGGLAGMLLAWELYFKGDDFLVFTNDAPAASNVAAGTWNPVTFRRMIPTWRAQEMVDAMLDFYPKIEKVLGADLLSMIEVEKILANEQEREFWASQAKTPESRDFLSTELEEVKIKGESKYMGIVKQTGRLNLPEFVQLSHAFFQKQNKLKKLTFDYKLLNENEASYDGDYSYNKIIFAEGYYAERNPFFNWLPFKSVKGEVLTVKSEALNIKKIRKKNIFILPIGNHTYKVGATYHWRSLNWEPSEEGKAEILEKFEKIIDVPYEVIQHEAGIRPATHDRRPFIGQHPTHKNILIFNGLGSKGVFLGPLLASEFCAHLTGAACDDASVHPEVSIKRCVKKYWENRA